MSHLLSINLQSWEILRFDYTEGCDGKIIFIHYDKTELGMRLVNWKYESRSFPVPKQNISVAMFEQIHRNKIERIDREHRDRKTEIGNAKALLWAVIILGSAYISQVDLG